MFLKNNTYTTHCDGTAIHARDLEIYTKQYQQELQQTTSFTNTVSISESAVSQLLATHPHTDPMTEYIITANKVQITNHNRQAMLSPDLDRFP